MKYLLIFLFWAFFFPPNYLFLLAEIYVNVLSNTRIQKTLKIFPQQQNIREFFVKQIHCFLQCSFPGLFTKETFWILSLSPPFLTFFFLYSFFFFSFSLDGLGLFASIRKRLQSPCARTYLCLTMPVWLPLMLMPVFRSWLSPSISYCFTWREPNSCFLVQQSCIRAYQTSSHLYKPTYTSYIKIFRASWDK